MVLKTLQLPSMHDIYKRYVEEKGILKMNSLKKLTRIMTIFTIEETYDRR